MRRRIGGPWPRVAIWHGTDDDVVHPDNAEASALQWIDLHEVALDPTRDVTSLPGTIISGPGAIPAIKM